MEKILNYPCLFFFTFFLLCKEGSYRRTTTSTVSDELFTCDNRERNIPLQKYCDGIDDCDDQSDENSCEGEALLLYAVKKPDRGYSEKFNYYIIGEYIKLGRKFEVQIGLPDVFEPHDYGYYHQNRFSNVTGDIIAAKGRYVYFVVFDKSNRQITLGKLDRNTMQYENDTVSDSEVTNYYNGKYTFDPITSNVYMLIKGEIRMCTYPRCTSGYVGLLNKSAKNAAYMTFSPNTGKIFWVEDGGYSHSSIVMAERDLTLVTVVVRGLISPTFLTLDVSEEMLYWVDFCNHTTTYKCLYNRNFMFNTTEEPRMVFVIDDGTRIFGCISLTVYKNIIYCLDDTRSIISTCNQLDCKELYVHTRFFPDYNNLEKISSIGNLIVQPTPAFIKKETVQNFTCVNKEEQISLSEFCDGIDDCRDQSDEKYCDGEALLLYAVQNALGKKYHIISEYINIGRQFKIEVTDFIHSNRDDIIEDIIAVNKRYVYFIVFNKLSNLITMGELNKKGIQPDIRQVADFKVKKYDTSPIFDPITSNVYMSIEGNISMCMYPRCNSEYTVLFNKFAKSVTYMTFSSNTGKIFWMENEGYSRSFIVMAERDLTGAQIIVRDLISPTFLTLDVSEEMLYWVDRCNRTTRYRCLHNRNSVFNITEKSRVVLGIDNPGCTSFAVYKNIIYCLDGTKSIIWTCNQLNCTTLQVHTNFSSPDGDFPVSSVGNLKIQPSPIVTKKVKNSCESPVCSHICTFTNSKISCYCPKSTEKLKVLNSGYCKNRTLIAAYGADLYSIGLFEKDAEARKTSLNITIAALTFNNLQDTVILTEINKQKIYNYLPKSGELQLISEESYGTINSIDFDDIGNNIYWIDPENYSIKILSLNTLTKTELVRGNSTNIPLQIALAPEHGVMFMLFSKVNANSLIVEGISMDGDPNTKFILYEDSDAVIGDLLIHYAKDTGYLFLFDQLRGLIKYNHILTIGVNRPSLPGRIIWKWKHWNIDKDSRLESIISMDTEIFWIDSTSTHILHRRYTSEVFDYYSFNITLDLNTRNHLLKITSVIEYHDQYYYRSLKNCLNKNGNCQQFCLRISSIDSVCRCAENYILVNSSSCVLSSKELSSSVSPVAPVIAITSDPLPSTVSESFFTGTKEHLENNPTKQVSLIENNEGTIAQQGASKEQINSCKEDSTFLFIGTMLIVFIVGLFLGFTYHNWREKLSFLPFRLPQMELQTINRESVSMNSPLMVDASTSEEKRSTIVSDVPADSVK